MEQNPSLKKNHLLFKGKKNAGSSHLDYKQHNMNYTLILVKHTMIL